MKKLVILGNGTDWCETSLKGLCNKNGVLLINKKMPINNPILRKIAHVHFSQRANRKVELPFKNVWFKHICQQFDFDPNNQNCLLTFDHSILGGNKEFIQYIRNKNPGIVLAYIFTNFVNGSSALSKGYISRLNQMYDLIYAFDPLDQAKYGFLYSPLIYDPVPIDTKNNTRQSAFYIGQAKDRLPILISIYERIKSLGIDLDFNIVNVPSEEMKHSDCINYNNPMTYNEVLEHISKSNCLVDGIQGGSTGLTIKTCEAVCYNKKLITTNKHLADYSFYDPRYMLIIESAEDITKDFFYTNTNVQYSDDAYYFFSGERFWNQIWSDING